MARLAITLAGSYTRTMTRNVNELENAAWRGVEAAEHDGWTVANAESVVWRAAREAWTWEQAYEIAYNECAALAA